MNTRIKAADAPNPQESMTITKVFEKKEDHGRSAVEYNFHVVGIGASAGGLEALEIFFDHVPVECGAAFVVVQHLSPDFKSVMDELLARHTKMAIHHVKDEMTVEPNSIYLIPPKKEMIINGRKLRLTDKSPQHKLNFPIDIFLRSLAQDAGEKAVAVVLSGTGSDGSRGIADVHTAGGLVLVQSEESAKFDGMPKAAMDTGIVDLDLPPEELPAAILKHARATTESSEAGKNDTGSRYGPILRLLRREYGIDFNHYKPSTVHRRIERRLSMSTIASISEYSRRLAEDSAELNAVYRDLLIGVTKFFRDDEVFKTLGKEVIPQLLAGADSDTELRVWVAGCATGEEAYSLAILFDEQRRSMARDVAVKLFATDVHRASLDFAARGVYDDVRLAQVGPKRMDYYFRKIGSSYQVTKELRKMVVFAPHNLLKDAPFTNLDLVTCRNLLIYFEPRAQKRALSLMHFGLKTSGTLVLGPSETPGELENEFETINRQWRIYKKSRDVKLPSDMRLPLPAGVSAVQGQPAERPARTGDISLMRAYDVLLARHMPPTFLIDENRRLIHSFCGAGRFIDVRDGRPSSDLLEMVCDDLRDALTSLLNRSEAGDSPCVYSNVRIRTTKDDQTYRLTISPVAVGTTEVPYTSIAIEPETFVEGHEPPADAQFDMDEVARRRIRELERELAYTKENLQATVEEMEATNQELQATNEEMVAANEELQSTNEELHSVNEELHSVNTEHQRKIEELTELTDDMDNLLSSTDVGTIFVDRKLAIRRYTPRIANTFHLAGQDIGRTIDTFAHTLQRPTLVDDIRSVIRSSQPLEAEVQNTGGRWYLLRILPYRSKGLTEGAVLSLIDIETLKASQAECVAAETKYEDLYNNAPDMYVTVDTASRRIVECNQTTADRLGYEKDEVAGRLLFELYHPDSRSAAKKAFEKSLQTGELRGEELQLQHRDGHAIDVSLNVSSVRDADGNIIRSRRVWRDITQLKRAQRELQQREERTRSIVDSALDAIVTIDQHSLVTRWNPQAEAIFGHSAEEVIGASLADLIIPPSQRQAHAIGMKRFLATGDGPVLGKRLEFDALHKSGRSFPVELTVVANRFGEAHEFTAFVRDITQRRLAEEEIRQAVQRRDHFLAMLSHELRNPLNAVLNAVYVMQRKHDDLDVLAESREVVHRQSSHMSRLLDDLLDVSRVTQGKVTLRLEPVAVAQAVDDAVGAVRPMLNERGQKLKIELSKESLFVRGDIARLQQIQVNLLNNASKYSPDGSTVQLSVTKEDDHAVIRIRDEGDGIPTEMLDSIFDLFVQNDATLHRASGGMGIGLTLVRSLVEMHKGQITVRSADGQGSEFEVRLPLIDRPPAPSSSDEAESKPHADTIVLVEDNVDARNMLKRMLELDDYLVHDAGDGVSGAELIEHVQPPVAIVDIGLPKLDGFGVAKRIREKFTPDEIRLVALTGYGQAQDRAAILAAGFDEHLVKPLQPEQLANVLTKVEG